MIHWKKKSEIYNAKRQADKEEENDNDALNIGDDAQLDLEIVSL